MLMPSPSGWRNYSLFMRDDGLLLAASRLQRLEMALRTWLANRQHSLAGVREDFFEAAISVPAEPMEYGRAQEVFHLTKACCAVQNRIKRG
jgi:hypothetical protein